MEKAVTVKSTNKLKLFVIRSLVNRALQEAFTESEDYFLGITGAENSGLGVYSVAMFDKTKWERV